MPPLTAQLRRAAQLLASGQTAAARAQYEQILQRNPDHPKALQDLASIYIAQSAFAPAKACLTRLVHHQPNNAKALFSLATAHFLLHEPDPALAALDNAIAIEPDHPQAHTARAQILFAKREHDAARDAASRALQINPAAGPAAAILAQLDRRAGNPEASRERMTEILPRLEDPADESACTFELAHALNDLAQFDAAFDAYEKAQSIQASLPASRAVDTQYPFRLIEQTRALLTPQRTQAWRDKAKPTEPPAPAFLIGFPRSGTTLTEQVIAAHPDAASTDEHPALSHIVSRIPQVTGSAAPYPHNILDISDAAASILRADYRKSVLNHIPESARTAKVVVDKLPLNILNIALIARLFPTAPILFALRDPRAVILSCMMQSWRPNAAMCNLMGLQRTARFYAATMDLWLDIKPTIANPIHEFHYEQTVHDLESQARALLEFLSLDFDPAVLDFHKSAKGKFISTPSAQAVAQPIHTAPAHRWKNYEHRLAPILPEIQRFIDIFTPDPPQSP